MGPEPAQRPFGLYTQQSVRTCRLSVEEKKKKERKKKNNNNAKLLAATAATIF